ncbi:hypothetical protein LguiA_009806 [Lonicera macranthoides]
MGSETKTNGGIGGGFRSRMEHYLYSGEKKHVFGGILIISVIFGIPWYFMNRVERATGRILRGHGWSDGQIGCSERSISRIKITWKELIKPGVRDFRLPQND